MERRETTPVDEEPPRKIPRRECSDSSETMSQSLETTRGSSDTTLASVSDPENTRSSEKSISVQWGTEDTMVKILQAMKAGAGPGAGVTIDELLERGPVLPDGERRTAARCFNSLLRLKQHGFIKVHKEPGTTEVIRIQLGPKFN